jgi:hypothetical protein
MSMLLSRTPVIMTLFLISAFFFALAGYGIYLRGKYTSSSECSRYARVFEGPDGTRYATNSILRINEFDPGPSQMCFEPSAIVRRKDGSQSPASSS